MMSCEIEYKVKIRQKLPLSDRSKASMHTHVKILVRVLCVNVISMAIAHGHAGWAETPGKKMILMVIASL